MSIELGVPPQSWVMSCGQADTTTIASISARSVTESPGFVGAVSTPMSPSGRIGLFSKMFTGCGISMSSWPSSLIASWRFSSQDAWCPSTPSSS